MWLHWLIARSSRKLRYETLTVFLALAQLAKILIPGTQRTKLENKEEQGIFNEYPTNGT